MQYAELEVQDKFGDHRWFSTYSCKQITRVEVDDLFQFAIASVRSASVQHSGHLLLTIRIPFYLQNNTPRFVESS